VDFTFPETLDATDRVWVRVARLILEGQVAIPPNITDFTATLSGVVDAGLELALTEAVAMQVKQDAFELEVFGTRMTFDDVSLFHHNARAVGGAEHLAALRRGEGASRLVQFRSMDGLPPRIFIPSLVNRSKPLVPVPWGIAGINEHPALAALQGVASDEARPHMQ
jgi:hypothetical protein